MRWSALKDAEAWHKSGVKEIALISGQFRSFLVNPDREVRRMIACSRSAFASSEHGEFLAIAKTADSSRETHDSVRTADGRAIAPFFSEPCA
jgi:hypothetical protein